MISRKNVLTACAAVALAAAGVGYMLGSFRSPAGEGSAESGSGIINTDPRSDVSDAAKVSFAPHRALYDIRLKATKSGSQIVNITGQMLYEWQPSCDAWTANHRFNLFYEYADSPPVRITSDFSTFEPFNGQSLDFTSQRKRGPEVFEELRGQAKINPDGTGEALYTLPKGLEYDLPQGTLFPMTHTLNVMKAIKEGKKFYNSTIFDGSDEDGPVEVNAFLGKPVKVTAFKDNKAVDQELLAAPAHDVRLAFFPLLEGEEYSDYEMNVTFHENGVISDMFIEYDDFSVTQKLIALEKMDSACGKPALKDWKEDGEELEQQLLEEAEPEKNLQLQ